VDPPTPHAVRTRLEWARLVVSRNTSGDEARSRELATAALELAQELDMPELADQAARLLTPAG
jgi:cell division protein FtsL